MCFSVQVLSIGINIYLVYDIFISFSVNSRLSPGYVWEQIPGVFAMTRNVLRPGALKYGIRTVIITIFQ